jgi:hypothetical protein
MSGSKPYSMPYSVPYVAWRNTTKNLRVTQRQKNPLLPSMVNVGYSPLFTHDPVEKAP